MQVLLVTNSYARIHNHYLALALSRHDVSFDVVSFTKPRTNNARRAGNIYKTVITVPFQSEEDKLRIFKCFLYCKPLFVLSNKARVFENIVSGLTDIKHYDVVIFEQLAMGQYYTCIPGNILQIIFPVDCMTRLKLQRYRISRFGVKKLMCLVDYLLTKFYEKCIYKKFRAVIFVSFVDAQFAIDSKLVAADKVHILRNAIECEYYCPNPSYTCENNSLCFAGNLADYKNEHAILWFYSKVWGSLKKIIPSIKLYIVGREPSEKVKRLSQLDNNIVVTGYVDDIRPYMWRCASFVSPLQIGTGIKNRILQAMAMGKAIVASPLSIEGIVGIKDGEHLLIARDGVDFLNKILLLLNNKEKAIYLGKQARQLIENQYSLDRYARDFLSIIACIVLLQMELDKRA